MAWRRLWSAFLFLLVLASLGASAYLFRALRQEQAARAKLEADVAAIGPRFEQFKDTVRDVGRRLSATVFQEVDLTASGWQPIAGGFYVIDLSTSDAGSGTRIVGKVINPTSVTHEGAQISVRIGQQRATFTLAHLPPAVAQPFEVTVPGPPPADHRAFFAVDSSTISFSSSSTRKRPGADPVDTDKLLK
ncbi:MAG: hypothetical protein ABUS79_29505 [Pseudomonadota bacterium]